MPSKNQSILIGSLVVALLSTSYLGLINLICCLGVIVGAASTVWHYTTTNKLTVPAGTGAGMGAAAGAIGAVIATILNFILMQAGLDGSDVINNMIMERFASQMDPEQLAEMEAQQEAARTVAGQATNAAIFFVVSAIFGAIGGAIGAAVFKKGTEGYDDV